MTSVNRCRAAASQHTAEPMDLVRVLSRVEAAAIVFGCAAQGVVFFLLSGPFESEAIIASTALSALAIVCILSFPHHADRRRLPALALGTAALIALGSFPFQGLVMLALLGVLGSRTAIAYGFAGAAAAWVVSALAIGLRSYVQMVELHNPFWLFVYSASNLLMLLAILFSALALLATALQRVRAYASRAAETAAIEERARIALDLHDALGHSLTTLGVQLQAADRLQDVDPAKSRIYVHRAVTTAATLLDDVRETLGMLRRESRGDGRFTAMVEGLFSDFARVDGIDFAYSVEVAREPAGATGMALFRAMQEALTNVMRHAAATRVRAWVVGTGDGIDARIEDDGVGFDAGAPSRGSGLAAMRDRVKAVGGTVSVSSGVARGTTVRVMLPLPR